MNRELDVMNRELVDPIANAVLYEGYILYPYRPSTKNAQRWSFGGLYPRSYCEQQNRCEAWTQQTECLVHGSLRTSFQVVVRFLHLTDRQVGAIDPPLPEWTDHPEPRFRPVEMLQVGTRRYHAWQEAEEREVAPAASLLGDLCASTMRREFRFEGGQRREPLKGPAGDFVGLLLRKQRSIEGLVEVAAAEVESGLFRMTIRTMNQTRVAENQPLDRDAALLHSFVSTHAILGLEQGEFVSMMDPPEHWRQAAAGCRNVGAWPVLVGQEGSKDTMLSSPIILYDYPRVAPESPGDFFDGTEIDEMLSLRIMTLTDDEKGAMASIDERAGALLARTESLAREQLLELHGTVRGLREGSTGGQA